MQSNYQYSIAQLAALGPPTPGYDRSKDRIALALAERLEAMVAVLERLDTRLEILTQIGPKLDSLVEATRGRAGTP